jgi:hypothetical protein
MGDAEGSLGSEKCIRQYQEPPQARYSLLAGARETKRATITLPVNSPKGSGVWMYMMTVTWGTAPRTRVRQQHSSTYFDSWLLEGGLRIPVVSQWRKELRYSARTHLFEKTNLVKSKSTATEPAGLRASKSR